MTRAEAKERNRRALLDAAFQVVSRDGYRARLEEIAERADVTTGAIYSLFGSKNGLVVAVVADHLRPYYEEIEQAVPAGLDLLEAVDAFARHYRRGCDAPDALPRLSLQITLLDMALHDPDLRSRLAGSIREQENHLIALFTGRRHNGSTVTSQQAQALTTALRALFVGLGQGIPLGLAPGADEQYFADTARALASGMPLVDHDADTS
ncbi:TetR/AcrR family transcriptional regulator [Streptomyces sp. NBC_00264]|uniref:TetR/AcrR family transcriptional regulator n=1 Tax=unclassified Streptomyces TaxID=2593676 RepID=UPI000F5BB49C|nr:MULTISPECIES: TetR/AcrR family transcriptional regulator [unclassified Streptomyces]WSG52370.1 TetR/AcrR family transcriptional regulator [Streptomyces sp. NBC_01732]WSX03003.1 TetR/AcrR family transcriptional regulator [Streptomyces sp. NBC_00987]MCX4395048.1 TetR/AcrR family transcriptional regulator [Streptomyces sp. NBC_01767]MCX5161828.1 TetR/AcrR family transcriptional regulator [Streptomyces sp. NBC_00305]MCX5220351.1 TetR/AcrR family transcriptional regulator [Streptomyces sp. NBC_0